MNTHPEKWYIPVTEENIDELNRWRLSKRPIEVKDWDFLFVPGAILLSEHPSEDSYFWSVTESDLNESYPSYQKITLEQFRQITNSTPNPKPMTQTKNLFDTINADAFYHLGRFKEKYPTLGDDLYEVFRSTSFWGDLKVKHLADLYMALPKEIWDGNIMTLVWVFQSQMTTTKTPSL